MFMCIAFRLEIIFKVVLHVHAHELATWSCLEIIRVLCVYQRCGIAMQNCYAKPMGYANSYGICKSCVICKAYGITKLCMECLELVWDINYSSPLLAVHVYVHFHNNGMDSYHAIAINHQEHSTWYLTVLMHMLSA